MGKKQIKFKEDDPKLVDKFQKRIDAGEVIGPKDWMPTRYREQLIRMMGQHAHSEIVGMLPEGNWITRAPSLKRKIALLAKVQDEGGHGLYLYCATETLGVSREELTQQLLDGRAKYSSVFNYPSLTWADMGAIGWLVDGAAIINQTLLAKCSYGPYASSMVRICKEESFHQKQGQELLTVLARGTERQKEMAQDSVNRWWWPAMMMFGPSDKNSKNSEELMRWKVKLKSNDELRQKFVDQMVPLLHNIGLDIPDSSLSYDKNQKSWNYGEVNWREFKLVLSGHGPMNRQRLLAKNRANEEGAWVREAAISYAAKQEKKRKGVVHGRKKEKSH